MGIPGHSLQPCASVPCNTAKCPEDGAKDLLSLRRKLDQTAPSLASSSSSLLSSPSVPSVPPFLLLSINSSNIYESLKLTSVQDIGEMN